MIEDWGVHNYRCPKCLDWKTVEAKGIVISGPTCKQCRTAMKYVELKQLDLGLFPEDEKTRRQRSNVK